MMMMRAVIGWSTVPSRSGVPFSSRSQRASGILQRHPKRQ